MQPETLIIQTPLSTCETRSPAVASDLALTQYEMAQLRETWLDHQINPVGESERRGVPYSALND